MADNRTESQRSETMRAVRGKEYRTRMVRSSIVASPWVSISPSRFTPTRKAGPRFSRQTKSYLRSRLLLACPWMSVRPAAEIQIRLLAPQARSQYKTRCGQGSAAAIAGMVHLDRMAVRNPVSRRPAAKTSSIYGSFRAIEKMEYRS